MILYSTNDSLRIRRPIGALSARHRGRAARSDEADAVEVPLAHVGPLPGRHLERRELQLVAERPASPADQQVAAVRRPAHGAAEVALPEPAPGPERDSRSAIVADQDGVALPVGGPAPVWRAGRVRPGQQPPGAPAGQLELDDLAGLGVVQDPPGGPPGRDTVAGHRSLHDQGRRELLQVQQVQAGVPAGRPGRGRVADGPAARLDRVVQQVVGLQQGLGAVAVELEAPQPVPPAGRVDAGGRPPAAAGGGRAVADVGEAQLAPDRGQAELAGLQRPHLDAGPVPGEHLVGAGLGAAVSHQPSAGLRAWRCSRKSSPASRISASSWPAARVARRRARSRSSWTYSSSSRRYSSSVPPRSSGSARASTLATTQSRGSDRIAWRTSSMSAWPTLASRTSSPNSAWRSASLRLGSRRRAVPRCGTMPRAAWTTARRSAAPVMNAARPPVKRPSLSTTAV